MVATFTVEGSADLMRAFDALPASFQAKVLRPALRAGAKAVLPVVEREAPRFSGAMAQSFGVRSAGNSRRGLVRFVVASGTKAELHIHETTKAGTPRGYYPTAIQYGWRMGRNALRRLRRRRATFDRFGSAESQAASLMRQESFRAAENAEFGTKFHPANPFMSRAFASSQAAASAAVMSAAEKAIGSLIEKTAVSLGVETEGA